MILQNKLPIFLPNNCSVEIQISNGEIEDGHEKIISEYSGPAYYSPSSKRVQNSEGIWVALAGFVYIKDDICPDLIEFSGKVRINNSQFYQFRGMKSLNPDGSVNHIKLEVAV